MTLVPPVAPMLARLERRLPIGADLLYEPKWDGIRCMAFKRGDNVDLRSRHDRPLARYFPEVVEGFLALGGEDVVVDGEIMVIENDRAHFGRLLERMHPAATRVDGLRREHPARFVAFDLLARGVTDLLGEPFAVRRMRLEEAMATPAPIMAATAITDDPAVAGTWLRHSPAAGIDGVMVKDRTSPYRAGSRAMVKVKRELTADCVVGGFRWHRSEPTVGSLLLGVNVEGRLHHVGLATGFGAELRRAIVHRIAPLMMGVEDHPWTAGFGGPPGSVARLPGAGSSWSYEGRLTWVPVRPELVCEVAYDHIDAGRLRHPGRLRRWRPDREPASCGFDQFQADRAATIGEVLQVA